MTNVQPDYLSGNVASWQRMAVDYVAHGEEAWASNLPLWGIWQIPDTELGLLPADMTGLRCIELGCGTGYVASWMARRGADVVAIDPTPNQLETARRLQSVHGTTIAFEQGFGESVPYPDASFDFAISEYGAALWADPHAWIPEAARLLKPGGRLTFLSNAPLMVLCAPDFESQGTLQPALLRPYFGLHRIKWPDSPGQTEFNLTHGDWIALFRANGLAVERLLELRAPEGATTSYAWADLGWARQWPTEDVWVLSKTT